MALTWPVVLAVLFGALLHASWNAFVKSSVDKALEMALVAALLGTWVLKEPFGLQRAAGTAVIVASVMALRLG